MSHDHGGEVVASNPIFAEVEVKHFQAEDIKAAGMIVGLMTGIFTIGLFLYAIVAWVVSGG